MYICSIQKAIKLLIKTKRMKLIKLGKQSEGKKDFTLISKTDKGYTIKCTGGKRNYLFNNVKVCQWSEEGHKVVMVSDHHTYEPPYDLGMWAKVEITKATEIKKFLLEIEKIK